MTCVADGDGAEAMGGIALANEEGGGSAVYGSKKLPARGKCRRALWPATQEDGERATRARANQ